MNKEKEKKMIWDTLWSSLNVRVLDWKAQGQGDRLYLWSSKQ